MYAALQCAMSETWYFCQLQVAESELEIYTSREQVESKKLEDVKKSLKDSESALEKRLQWVNNQNTNIHFHTTVWLIIPVHLIMLLMKCTMVHLKVVLFCMISFTSPRVFYRGNDTAACSMYCPTASWLFICLYIRFFFFFLNARYLIPLVKRIRKVYKWEGKLTVEHVPWEGCRTSARALQLRWAEN